MQRLHEIVAAKGGEVVTGAPEESLGTAIQRMADHNIGALVVMDGLTVVGIISERDCVRLLARSDGPIGDVPVREVMSSPVVLVDLETEVQAAMELMTEHRVRHLPVVEAGRLSGIVSIGDVVKSVSEAQKAQIELLTAYITAR